MSTGRRVLVGSAVAAALNVGEELIWSRGFRNVEAQIEANRERLSKLMPDYPPSKRVIVFASTAGLGALASVAWAPYGLVRPFLPVSDDVAGAFYAVGWSAAANGTVRLVRRRRKVGPSRLSHSP